jgi:hypothetical protein
MVEGHDTCMLQGEAEMCAAVSNLVGNGSSPCNKLLSIQKVMPREFGQSFLTLHRRAHFYAVA